MMTTTRADLRRLLMMLVAALAVGAVAQRAPDADEGVEQVQTADEVQAEAGWTHHTLSPKAEVTPDPGAAARPAIGDGDDEVPLYRLRVGDELAIRIYGELGSLRHVLVDATGQITYLLVGQVEAAGKTLPELRDELQRAIEKRMKHSLVAITPVRFGGMHYTISGQVRHPGRRPLEGETTLLEGICRAGGWATGEFRNSTVDLADLDHSFLMRDRQRVPVDFAALVEEGDMAQNVLLKPGDYVYIASGLVKNVYILGEVRFPRILGFRTQISLMEALTEARGLTPRAAKRAIIVRGSLSHPEQFVVRTDRLLDGSDPDIMLRAGDIVYVPIRDLYHLEVLGEIAVNAFVSTIASDAASWTWNRKIEPTLPKGDADGSGRDININL